MSNGRAANGAERASISLIAAFLASVAATGHASQSSWERRMRTMLRWAVFAAFLTATPHVPSMSRAAAESLPAAGPPEERRALIAAGLRLELESEAATRALMRATAAWLASELGFPLVEVMPAIRLASPARLAGLRYRDLPSERQAHGQPDVLAVYDAGTRTIYLLDGWSGNSPRDLSVLVHEMVHHIQAASGMRFACPEEREKAAFDAQQRWLALFDTNLETAFGIDPFTLLVRTTCLY